MHNDTHKEINKAGTLYGIGIGPGDPELLTVKGARVLKEVDWVVAPKASIKSSSLAADIIHSLVPEEKISTIVFPMTKDKQTLEKHWRGAAMQVSDKLASGKNVAFVTIGDPSVYSTYSYLVRYLREKNSAISIKTIPGISIINATAALFSEALVEGNERFAVMPLPGDLSEIEKFTDAFDTLVLLKINKRLEELVAYLEKKKLTSNAYFVHRLGHKNEFTASALVNLKGLAEEIGYFSTMIIRIPRERKRGS